MKKNYLITLFCAISSLAISQTVEIVKDYYPTENAHGLGPKDMISNSTMMVFSGIEASVSKFGSTYYFYEPFVTDGTSTNLTKLDIVSGDATGQQSAPSKHFIINDVIYFVANNGTDDGIYKVTDINGSYELVTNTWTPQYQPVKHTGLMNAIAFPGTDPANANDAFNYVIEWAGDASIAPNVAIGHSGLYNMNPSPGFACISVAGKNHYVMAAKDPNNASSGWQLCTKYKTNRGLHGVEFTSLNSDPTINDYPEHFTAIGYAIYFNDSNGQIWKVDLTQGYSATQVTTINNAVTTGINSTKIMGSYNNKLVFYATPSGASTTSVFIYDPSADIVTELNAGFEIRNPESLSVMDGKMYFAGQYNTIPYDANQKGNPLWCYDGTNLTQIGTDLKFVTNPYGFNGKVYFSAEDLDGVDNGDGTFSSTYKEMFVYDPNGTPTAIQPAFNANTITVSPNPSYGYVNITGMETNATYEIFSVAGSLLEQGAVVNGQIDYNVQSGVYLLKITEGSNTKVVKIMVK